jgi:hypothetical protein
VSSRYSTACLLDILIEHFYLSLREPTAGGRSNLGKVGAKGNAVSLAEVARRFSRFSAPCAPRNRSPGLYGLTPTDESKGALPEDFQSNDSGGVLQ